MMDLIRFIADQLAGDWFTIICWSLMGLALTALTVDILINGVDVGEDHA